MDEMHFVLHLFSTVQQQLTARGCLVLHQIYAMLPNGMLGHTYQLIKRGSCHNVRNLSWWETMNGRSWLDKGELIVLFCASEITT